HLIAGERHHLAAQLQMQGVKRRTAQNVRRDRHGGPDEKSPRRLTAHGPSVIGPERFPPAALGLPLRWKQLALFRFPEVHHPIAVLLPESFRGGCSFGGLPKRLSPAWDRVLATPTAPPADGDVAMHHKGGGF